MTTSNEVRLVGPVTTGGWYRTVDGRWAEVVWRGGFPQTVRVADRIPTREEEDAQAMREWAEQDAQRDAELAARSAREE